MDKVALLNQLLASEPARLVFSRPLKGKDKTVVVRMEGSKFPYQAQRYTGEQIFHTAVYDLKGFVAKTAPAYRELHVLSDYDHSFLLKDGAPVGYQKGQPFEGKAETHNRVKPYIINEGDKLPVFVKLGIFTKDYKIVNSKQDKFRQVNRYLEMLRDVLVGNPKEHLYVVDFGCGKSYLTFAVYYYLTAVLGKSVTMVGVDLKRDVIAECNRWAEEFGYQGLSFVCQDIKDFAPSEHVDLVISLHACDIATDYVLYGAIKGGADTIFSVPCCQHEVGRQLDRDFLPLMLHQGIVRERFAALLTDSVRAALLEVYGYKVDMMEFVDLTDSPKNILLRATKTNHSPAFIDQRRQQIEEMLSLTGAEPTLWRLLEKVES